MKSTIRQRFVNGRRCNRIRVEKANSLFHRNQFDIEAVIPGRGRGYGEKHSRTRQEIQSNRKPVISDFSATSFPRDTSIPRDKKLTSEFEMVTGESGKSHGKRNNIPSGKWCILLSEGHMFREIPDKNSDRRKPSPTAWKSLDTSHPV